MDNIAERGNAPSIPEEALAIIREIAPDSYDFAWKVWTSPRPISELQAVRTKLERARYEEKLAVAYGKAITFPARAGGYTVREVSKFTGLSFDVIVNTRSHKDPLFKGIKPEDIENVNAFIDLPPSLGSTMSREMIGVQKNLEEMRRRAAHYTARAKVASVVAWYRGINQHEIARNVGITRVTIRRTLGQSV